MGLRGERDMLRQQLGQARRENRRLRAAVLHECEICRIAWCDAREKLIREALGRNWLRTEVPG